MDVVAALPDLWREWEVLRLAPPRAAPAGAVRAAAAADGVTSACRTLVGVDCPDASLLPRAARSPSRRRPRAQSPSRDWRPEDRTVIGDFSRITAVAAALDRVYVSLADRGADLESAVPPVGGSLRSARSAALLARVFAALVDPLDNSLWLARPDGWMHFQPELQLWDQGAVPGRRADDRVRRATIRRRASSSGRAAAGSCCRAAASCRRPVACPARPRHAGADRRRAPQQPDAAGQRGADPDRPAAQRRRATPRPRARFDNLGWYLGTSGVGPAVPARRRRRFPSGCPSGSARRWSGAVFSWPDGVWAATDRTPQRRAALTFVDARAQASFAACRGRRRPGCRSPRCGSSPGRARRSGPRPTAGSRGSPPATAASIWWTRRAGCPTAGVRGRLAAGPDHGRDRGAASPG